MWNLMPEHSKGNNHTSKINVFPLLHMIFFLLGGHKMDLFAPQGSMKCSLWPTSRKKYFLFITIFLIFYFTLVVELIELNQDGILLESTKIFS